MGMNRVVEVAQSLVLGLVSFVTGPSHVVLVGLDSSGKTTALLRLKYGQYVNAVPTVGFNCERVRCGGGGGGGHWLVWDVGGAERVRPLWRSYTRATDAIVFVVDSSSSLDRLEEARVELHRLARQQNSDCAALNRSKPPLLVLANKQDLPGARDTQQLAKALGLADLPQPWAMAAVCAVTGEGLEEAMAALQHLLLKTKRIRRK